MEEINVFEILQKIEKNLLLKVKNHPIREDFYATPDSNALVIVGERGIGKTTLLLQKRNSSQKKGIYISADNQIILSKGLFMTVWEMSESQKIEECYIDEIFRYPNWQQELKNIIDSIPSLKLFISGSSSLSLYKSLVDLSRRIDVYHMEGLSFREYLVLKHNISLPKLTWKELFENPQKEILRRAHEVHHEDFQEYLQFGFYPFGITLPKEQFFSRLFLLLEKVVIEDLPSIKNFRTISLEKIQKVFYFLAHMSPSEISIYSLSKKIGVNNILLEDTLYFLSKIGVIHLIPKSQNISDKIRKEYKIFLGNPNLYYSLGSPLVGTLRESFFLSQVQKKDREIYIPSSGDFRVKEGRLEYIFEIGGRGKNKKQILNNPNAFLVKDVPITTNENELPLWIFGFLK